MDKSEISVVLCASHPSYNSLPMFVKVKYRCISVRKQEVFCEEDQFLPSPLHRSQRLRCSSSRPPHRIREEQPEPDRFVKKAKLTTRR
ncbi:hypothetical protein M0R45_013287 [Rubus argutus]|uniref:Uncharacterized protein n=1 Tax=Rubus argutus TaxID=59490 RepID=A0AAW1XJ12_RUBAR